MSQPFFSIVIPTRNRPEFILDTAISAVAQQFDSFEVILSDNSSDNATRDRLRAIEHIGGITYVRPPQEVPMPDHWEFATLQARGKYVLVLTDRSVLKQGALAAICRVFNEHGQDAIQTCSWRWSLFDDELGVEFSGAGGVDLPHGQVLDSATVATEFVSPRKSYPYKLPRALNSCYGNTIAAKIRAQHGRLFCPLSPDFTSAFLMLAHTKKILYIDAPLFISRGLSSSTGGNSYRSSETGYLEGLGLKDWYRHVPIKAVLVENLLFEDFLAVQNSTGNRHCIEVNWIEYFVRCYREILGKNLTRRQIELLHHEWERALKGMKNDLQQQVRSQLRSMWGLKLRAAVHRLPYGVNLVSALRKLKRILRSSNSVPTTVLKAAGFSMTNEVNVTAQSTHPETPRTSN